MGRLRQAIELPLHQTPEYLDAFRRVLAYYLERLPEDLVPYWDMTFTSGTEEPRDSSSASIVACGLLEAAKYVGTDEAAEYTKLAAPDAGQRGRALRRQGRPAGHWSCAPRHLQQKEPLQHLHPGGRG